MQLVITLHVWIMDIGVGATNVGSVGVPFDVEAMWVNAEVTIFDVELLCVTYLALDPRLNIRLLLIIEEGGFCGEISSLMRAW